MPKLLGDVAVGTVLRIKENGTYQDYILIHQGNPSSYIYDSSCNGCWLLRNNIAENRQWHSYDSNDYANSTIHSYLNGNFLNRFEETVRNAIKQVKIPYRPGAGNRTDTSSGSRGLSTKVFLLSGIELNLTPIYSAPRGEGTVLSYFSDTVEDMPDSKRVAYYGRNAAEWWQRSPHCYNTAEDHAATVQEDGYDGHLPCSYSVGVRPAMIMPQDIIVDDNNNITGNTVPTAPTSITVPTEAIPAGQSIAVSWTAVSGAESYTLQRKIDDGSWQTINEGSETSYTDTAGVWDSVQYQVEAVTSGFHSGYTTSSVVTVLPYTITVLTTPSLIMRGQQIPISWSSVSAATTYVLERNVDSGGWNQLYSGGTSTYTDTAGEWNTVQYRVKAGANEVYGSYKTSESIPVISPDVLVISGQDGDLGTLVNDVPYTVTTDTSNPITVKTTVNGVGIFNGQVESGTAKAIPVLDIINMRGTIVIEASVEASNGPVSAKRTWTYNKDPITFPNSGSPAQLQKHGKNIFPKTLAECVRMPGGLTLDKVIANSTVTLLSTGWTQSDGIYKQTVSCPIVWTLAPMVILDPELTGEDQDADDQVLEAWQSGPGRKAAVQGEGTLTFYSTEAPTVNIPVNVGVV